MQISQVNETELSLLITGLRSIYIADVEPVRLKLAQQLENELSTRYGKMIGAAGEQERNR